jgi:RHS repeat-associated protein
MLLPVPKDERVAERGDSVPQRLGIPEWCSMTRVRKKAAMHSIFTVVIAISLALMLVAPAAAAVGMPWPWLCDYWPGHYDCGTLSSPPTTSVCYSSWLRLDQDYGICGGREPGVNNKPGATAQAGQVVKGADPVDLTTGIFMLTKVDAAFPGIAPIAFERTYRSGDTFPGPFGLGTTLEYDAFIEPISATLITYVYRANARTEFIKQADGTFTNGTIPAFRGTTITLNADGTRTMRRKDGSTTVFNTQGLQVSRSDRFGNTVTIGRGTNTAVSTITGSAGRSLSLSWVGTLPQLRVSQVTDSTGRTVRYDYDGSQRLVAVTDAAGGVTRYSYDSQHRMTSIKDAREIVFLTNTYDVNSRVCRQQQADGGVFTLYYVTADIASTPDSTLLLQQAESGGPITQAPCTGPASTSRVVATVLVDPRGHPTTYRFDASGLVTKTTDAMGQATAYEREAVTNLLLSTTDPLGRKTVYSYDAAGNVTNVTRLAATSGAVTTNFTYAPTFNQMTSVTDPLGHSTTFAYDPQGRLTRITNALGEASTVTPGPTGQPVAIADDLGNTTQFAYTAGDLVSITDPVGNVTTRSLDSAGRLATLTNPLGQRTSYDYDVFNHVTRITDALNGLTRFTYDANGNLHSVTDARGSVTAYAYDNMDRVASRTDPLGRSESSTYDLNGNLASSTDRRGQVTNRTYDALDRLTQVTYADGSTIAYGWDAGNRLTAINDSQSGSIMRWYEPLDRLTEEWLPDFTRVYYTYDAAGRRTDMTVDGQLDMGLLYSYDDANRLTSVYDWSNFVSFTYDAAGRRTSVTMPYDLVTEYTYDAASRVTGLVYRKDTTTLGTLSYMYDAAGNRLRVGGTWARTGLPPALASASYDAANRHLSFGAQAVTYDLNGNLLNDGTNSYTWDARNRLTGIAGPITATFEYDAIGHRTRKTIDGWLTDFVHDGINPVTELGLGGATAGSLVTGLGVDDFLLYNGGWNGTSMFLTDALGSLVATTDSAGAVQSEVTYEPFGATQISSPGLSAPAYRFTGREHDEPLYLYYYRARYYHTDLQRFISEDPIGFAAGDINLYGYVGNNPVTASDPFGLEKQACPAVPPSPPGVNVNVNMSMAMFMGAGPLGMESAWFGRMVTNNGAWDYKRSGKQYTAFGNFNFGATGTAMGYPEEALLRSAGAYQVYRALRGGAYDPRWGTPIDLDGPFGDDPSDQAQIREGIRYARCRGMVNPQITIWETIRRVVP